jgi:hypothetical protein
MLATIHQYTEGFANQTEAHFLRASLVPIGDRMSSQPLVTAGLVIHGATSALAKTGAAAYYGVANGVPVTIAASTDMPALTGAAYATTLINIFCFFIDQGSVVTSAGGTAATTLAGVKWPPFPKNKALVGFLIVTASGTFTPGTTALDTGTTVYVSPVGAFDPTILTG